MAENSEGKTPSHLKTKSRIRRSYHWFRHTFRKYVMKFSKIFLIGVFETKSRIRRSYHWFRHTVRKFSRNLSLIIRRFFSSSTLMFILIGILVLLIASLVSVMFFEPFEQWVGLRLGLPRQKNQILTFLGIGLGGILFILQVMAAQKRAKAMEDTAKQQVIANQNTQQGLQQERLKNAIEHLGNDSDSVRLGGAYELFHLAQDTKKEALQRMRSSGGADERFHLAQDTPDLRQTVLDILCAHIRRTTGEDKYRKTQQSKPSEEVQSLLTLLFVQNHDVFEGLPINLQNSWLNGADLQNARLQKAILKQANLRGARLDRAHLQEANLVEAHLEETVLEQANLQGAKLISAHMQEAYLPHARLQGANLRGAHLQAAYLHDAHLQGTVLDSVRMQAVFLSEARLQGAKLSYTQMQGAILDKANLKGAGTQDWASSMDFAERINKSIGKESDLSTVSFGGLCQKAANALEEGLSEEKIGLLRQMLSPHIGKPFGLGLPENSSAITGAYNKEEAEEWIVEYKRAMP